MNGWTKCLQEPNIYNVHLTWRMINIVHAVVLSWIKKKNIFEYIYQSTCKNETWYCNLNFISIYVGPYFESSLNNNSCVQKSGIPRFPLLVLPHHFGIWTTKKIIHITRLFYDSNLRIKSYHSLTEIDLVFYHHLYQITQL